jgi:murein L,D-transpeptidase YcbB/YkuD
MTTAETEMTALTNKVNALSSEEKAYYDLLNQQYEEPNAVQKRVSWKKFTFIGAFLGAVAAAGVVCMIYLFDGKLKSASELEQSCAMLSQVSVQGKKNLFGKLAAFLTHADNAEPAAKTDMLAADLGILMEKNKKASLMLVCGSEDAEGISIAEQVHAKMQEKNRNLEVFVGNPLSSVNQLEQIAQADMVVFFVELKNTKRAEYQEWKQICARYRVPVAGAVAVQKCW